MNKKYNKITVLKNKITITSGDFISLTDMLKAKDGDFFISEWISAEFKIYLVNEFQRLKEKEQGKLEWNVKRQPILERFIG